MAIRLPLFSKKRDEDEEYYDYEDNTAEVASSAQNEDDDMNVVTKEEITSRTEGFSGINDSAVSLKVMSPKSFAEATKVAECLMAGSTVVLNIEAFEKADLIRFMDFLMGVLYVIRGNMKKVSKTTIVVSPSGIDADGEARG